jgi:hypothetical protein
MQIRKIDTTSPQDLRQFVNLPFELYKHDPNWVPPLVDEMKFVLNRDKHPFYQHSEADFFVAESQGQALARVAVLDNRRYNQYHQSSAAFFYYFECVQDPQVARALFDVAVDWAKQRQLNRLLGPKGMLITDGFGILVDGFRHRPALGIPYNPPYYVDLITGCGFEKETDYVSGYLHRDYQLSERIFDVAERVKKRRGFHIKVFKDKAEMRAWGPRIREVYNQAFVNVWGFCPLTEGETQVIADRLVSIAHPRLIKLVMKGDEVVGFLLAYHDISAALQKARGRLWPLGWLYILLEYRRTKWANLNGIGLLPEHQGVGADTVLFTELEKSLREFQFEHADLAQINEKNAKSKGEMEALGIKWYKRHRVYRLDF